jgi:hypothetical protein
VSICSEYFFFFQISDYISDGVVSIFCLSSHLTSLLLSFFSFFPQKKHRVGDKWNHVKVEYIGFDGLFQVDLLKDEILE